MSDNMVCGVTVKLIQAVTGFDKTIAGMTLRVLVSRQLATPSGNRKHLKLHATEGVIVVAKGKPSITYDIPRDALATQLGSVAADKLADMAAQEAADYARQFATASHNAEMIEAKAKKAAKGAALEAKLAEFRAANAPTGDVF
jgi:hypothetical protein